MSNEKPRRTTDVLIPVEIVIAPGVKPARYRMSLAVSQTDVSTDDGQPLGSIRGLINGGVEVEMPDGATYVLRARDLFAAAQQVDEALRVAQAIQEDGEA